jgi:hypothetical protein
MVTLREIHEKLSKYKSEYGLEATTIVVHPSICNDIQALLTKESFLNEKGEQRLLFNLQVVEDEKMDTNDCSVYNRTIHRPNS